MIYRFVQPKFGVLASELRILIRSRIFWGFCTIPTAYFGLQGFQYLQAKYVSNQMNKGKADGSASPNLGYPSDHPVNRFIRPQLSYWDRFRIWVASVIHDLLTDKTIEAEGLNYLDRVFRHK